MGRASQKDFRRIESKSLLQDLRIEAVASLIRTYKDTSCDSGAKIERSFCGDCGSNLFMTNLVNPLVKAIYFAPTGTFDGSVDGLAPDVEFYCKRRRAWPAKSPGSKEFDSMQ